MNGGGVFFNPSMMHSLEDFANHNLLICNYHGAEKKRYTVNNCHKFPPKKA